MMIRMHRYISGPAISHLTLTHRMVVNDRLRACTSGQPFRCGRIVYADLEAVERLAGMTFSDAQIEAALEGRSDRLITVETPPTEDAHV